MKKIALIASIALLPVVTFAQLDNVENLASSFGRIVQTLIPIVFALAVLGFFWGVVKFIFGGSEAKESGKQIMVWGIVAIAVMSLIWGLVAWLGDAFGVQSEDAVDVQRLIPNI